MKVRHVLASKSREVLTARPDQSVREVVAVLARHNIGVLLVVDDRGEIAGIISERDIVRHAVEQENLFSLPVSQVMTANVITGMPGDDIVAVSHTMMERNFRHLPIVEDGRLVGIISIRDVLKAQLNEYQGEIDTLETRILAEEAGSKE
jgi:CBS domain-containing protein